MEIVSFTPNLIFEVNDALKPEDRWPNLENIIQDCRENIPFNNKNPDAKGIFLGWGLVASNKLSKSADGWAFHHTISTSIVEDPYVEHRFFSWHHINEEYSSWKEALYKPNWFTLYAASKIVPVYNVGDCKYSPTFVDILNKYGINAKIDYEPLKKVETG